MHCNYNVSYLLSRWTRSPAGRRQVLSTVRSASWVSWGTWSRWRAWSWTRRPRRWRPPSQDWTRLERGWCVKRLPREKSFCCATGRPSTPVLGGNSPSWRRRWGNWRRRWSPPSPTWPTWARRSRRWNSRAADLCTSALNTGPSRRRWSSRCFLPETSLGRAVTHLWRYQNGDMMILCKKWWLFVKVEVSRPCKGSTEVVTLKLAKVFSFSSSLWYEVLVIIMLAKNYFKDFQIISLSSNTHDMMFWYISLYSWQRFLHEWSNNFFLSLAAAAD